MFRIGWVGLAIAISISGSFVSASPAKDPDQQAIDDLVEGRERAAKMVENLKDSVPLVREVIEGVEQKKDFGKHGQTLYLAPKGAPVASPMPARGAVWVGGTGPSASPPPAPLMRVMALTNDPSFQENSRSIVSNANLKWLFVTVAILSVVYVLVRRAALAATDRWWARLVVRLSLIPVFYLVLAMSGYLFLGQPLVAVVWALKKALFNA